MTRIRPAAWLIAAVALFLLAVAGYALLVHAFPQYYWKQIDTAVYRDGGIAVRNQPAMLYALELGAAKLPFTYTPFAALLFAAGSGASFATWQVGLAVLTIGLLPVVAYLSLGLAGRPAGVARAAAWPFCSTVTPPVLLTASSVLPLASKEPVARPVTAPGTWAVRSGRGRKVPPGRPWKKVTEPSRWPTATAAASQYPCASGPA